MTVYIILHLMGYAYFNPFGSLVKIRSDFSHSLLEMQLTTMHVHLLILACNHIRDFGRVFHGIFYFNKQYDHEA
jgi:hypothetical protein